MHLLRNKPVGRFSPSCLFRPASITVIGAGWQTGAQVMANLRSCDFKGTLQQADTVEDIEALPSASDLAVIAFPPTQQLFQALAAKGTFAAVVVCDAGGLSDPEIRGGVRVLGPGSFGIVVPAIGLNASRAHLVPPAGRIGLVSQSASLCRTVLDWAGPNGVGFSHIVGIGGRADIGFGLVLDWLSRDPGTGAILLDIRQLRNRRAFLSAARAASRLRPVVAIQSGSSIEDPGGGTERAFEAALRRAGVLCVTNLEDLLAAAEILARARPVRSEALSIITNAITAGRMAADAVLRNGLRLASDIVHVEPGDSGRLATLATATSTQGVGGVLVVHAPSGALDEPAIDALAECRDKMKVPLLVCAMGETTGAASRSRLAAAGMAVFATPEHAVRGFLHLVQDRRNRAAARELPHSTVLTVAPDRDAVREVFASMRRAGRLATMQDEALAVLCAYGIPVVPSRAVASAGRCGCGGIAAGLPGRGEAPPERAPRRPSLRWSGARSARCDRGHGGSGADCRAGPLAAGAAPGGSLASASDPG